MVLLVVLDNNNYDHLHILVHNHRFNNTIQINHLYHNINNKIHTDRIYHQIQIFHLHHNILINRQDIIFNSQEVYLIIYHHHIYKHIHNHNNKLADNFLRLIKIKIFMDIRVRQIQEHPVQVVVMLQPFMVVQLVEVLLQEILDQVQVVQNRSKD